MKIQSILFVLGLAVLAAGVQAEQTEQTAPSVKVDEQGTTTEATDSQPAATDATEAASTQPAENTAAEEQAGFSRGSVVRSVFTTAVQDREPVDKIKDTEGKTGNVFYFTELRDMSGQTATHRWEHKGEVVSEVKFNVRGPRWRVWSSKAYTPGWEGEWKVSVLNGAGEVISEDLVMYSAPTANAAAPAADSESDATPESGTEQNFEPPVNSDMIQ